MFGQGAARLFLPDPGNPPPYDVIRDFPDSTSSWPKTATDSAVKGHCGRLPNVRLWLIREVPATSAPRPVYPQLRTFKPHVCFLPDCFRLTPSSGRGCHPRRMSQVDPKPTFGSGRIRTLTLAHPASWTLGVGRCENAAEAATTDSPLRQTKLKELSSESVEDPLREHHRVLELLHRHVRKGSHKCITRGMSLRFAPSSE